MIIWHAAPEVKDVHMEPGNATHTHELPFLVKPFLLEIKLVKLGGKHQAVVPRVGAVAHGVCFERGVLHHGISNLA